MFATWSGFPPGRAAGPAVLADHRGRTGLSGVVAGRVRCGHAEADRRIDVPRGDHVRVLVRPVDRRARAALVVAPQPGVVELRRRVRPGPVATGQRRALLRRAGDGRRGSVRRLAGRYDDRGRGRLRHRRPLTIRRGHPETNPVSVVGGRERVLRAGGPRDRIAPVSSGVAAQPGVGVGVHIRPVTPVAGLHLADLGCAEDLGRSVVGRLGRGRGDAGADDDDREDACQSSSGNGASEPAASRRGSSAHVVPPYPSWNVFENVHFQPTRPNACKWNAYKWRTPGKRLLLVRSCMAVCPSCGEENRGHPNG